MLGDTYPYLVSTVENEWRNRYGDTAAQLRRVLEDLDPDFPQDLPNFPSTTHWIYRSMIVGSAVDRRRRQSQ